jgi:hypothetical protein
MGDSVIWFEDLGFDSREGKSIFLLCKISKSALGPPGFLLKGYRGFFSQG